MIYCAGNLLGRVPAMQYGSEEWNRLLSFTRLLAVRVLLT